MADDEFDKIVTPRGDGRSMTPLKPTDVSVSFSQSPPGTGSDWFGPGAPMHPIAPPEVAGRQFDYPVGFNRSTQSRAYEPVDAHTLRMLAGAFDPVRLIIERRKDQLCRVPWAIRPKHDKALKASPPTSAIAKDVEHFFRFPSEGLSFRAWLRQILEDLLVLDAPAIYCSYDANGNLVALDPVDGGTIKPVIDDRGRLPRPIRWDGSPFSWCGQTVTTKNYQDIGCKIANGMLYVPAYQQLLKGLPAVNLTSWDLIYKPLNLRTNSVFGKSPVEMILRTVNIAMRRSLAQLEYFREGNQPDAIYGLPETWTPDQVQRFQDYFDSIYSGNLTNRRRMKFIPSGTGSRYTATKEPPLKNQFDEYLIRIVCFAFSYPPAAFISLSNRSIAEQHEKQAEEEGVEPLKAWASELFNEIITRRFGIEDLEFAWTEEQEIDPEKQSNVLTKYAESGVLTLNQVREKIGEEPDPDPAANRLMVRTPTGYVPVSQNQNGELK